MRYPDEHDAAKASLLLTHTVEAGAVAISSPIIQDGMPRQRFKKELIRAGRYVPAQSDKKFLVTVDLLRHWEQTFNEMKKAGITIPVPAGHTSDAESTMGHVVEMFVEESSLFGILEMIGADGIATAIRNDVSVFSPPEWRGGDGHVYKRPILHVALTPYPVVPGLKGFETIAASLMETDMDWKKVQKAFAIDAATELTDASAEELLLGAAKTRAEKLKTLTDEIARLKKEIAALKLSHDEALEKGEGENKEDKPKKIDPVLASLVVENRQMKINRLAEMNAIAPVVAKDLAAIFAQEDGLTMSLAPGNDLFDKLLVALEKNTALLKLTKEQTGPQLLALSQMTNDEATDIQKQVIVDAENKAKEAKERTIW